MAAHEHEYVKVNEYSRVRSLLTSCASDFQKGADSAFSARDLHKDKLIEIAKAREMVSDVLKDAAELNKHLLKEALKHELDFKKTKTTVAKVTAHKTKRIAAPRLDTEQDYLVGSQKALENLQKNIRDLKEHLGV